MALVVGPSLATCSFPRVCIAVYVRRKFQSKVTWKNGRSTVVSMLQGSPQGKGNPLPETLPTPERKETA